MGNNWQQARVVTESALCLGPRPLKKHSETPLGIIVMVQALIHGGMVLEGGADLGNSQEPPRSS